MLLIRFIDLFTLSHDGKQNQQVGGDVYVASGSSSAISVLWCGYVVATLKKSSWT